MDDLIQIYTAPNKGMADLLKGFLENNGIKTLIQPAYIGLDGSGGYAGNPAVAPGPWKIYVFKEKEVEARKLIENKELLERKEQGYSPIKANKISLIYKVIALIFLVVIFFWIVNILRLFIQDRF